MFVSAPGLHANRKTHSSSIVLRERPADTDGRDSLQAGNRETPRSSFSSILLSNPNQCYSYSKIKDKKNGEIYGKKVCGRH